MMILVATTGRNLSLLLEGHESSANLTELGRLLLAVSFGDAHESTQDL